MIDEIANIAFANMGDFVAVDEAGNVKIDFPKFSKEALRPVAKIRQKHTRQRDDNGDWQNVIETQFELCDKLGALEKLARTLGVYAPEKHEHTVKHEDALKDLA